MVNCLYGLGHDTVVCSNHKNDNICQLGSTGTHHGECGMTRGIQEDDIALVRDVDLVCTDMLGDSSELACDDVCRSDCIKELGLTMVNVTHDSDNRSSRDQILLGILLTSNDCLIIEVHKMHGASVLLSDDCGCVTVNALVHADHHTHAEQLGDDLRCLDVHLSGKITDCDG